MTSLYCRATSSSTPPTVEPGLGDGVGAALTAPAGSGALTFNGQLVTQSGISVADGVNATFNENVTLGQGDTGTTLFGNVALNGMTLTSAGTLTFGNSAADTLTLGVDDVTITTAASGAIQTYNAAVVGGQDLRLAAGTGTIAFNANVGAGNAIGDGAGSAITIDSGATTFVGTVNTNSGMLSQADVMFQDNVTIAAGDTASRFNENVTLDGLTFTSGGAVTFGDAGDDQVTLSSGAVTVNTSGGNANQTYNGRVDGAQNLTLNAGSGTTAFNANVGSVAPIGSGLGAALTVNSTGTTTFNGTLATASGIDQNNAAGAITFRENVTLGDGDTNTTFNANVVLDGLTFTANDPVTFGNAAADRVTLSGGTVVLVTSDDALTFNSVTNGGQNLVLNSGAAATTFNAGANVGATNPVGSGVGPAITVLSAGTTDFGGTVTTSSGLLQSNAAGTVTFREDVEVAAGDTPTRLNGNVTLDGMTFTADADLTFGNSAADALTLSGGAVTVTTAAANAVQTYNATVDSALGSLQNLTLAAGTGTTTFNANVGPVSGIGSGLGAALTINSGFTTFNGTVGTNSGITSNADVLFRQNVTIAAGNTPTTFNENVTLDGLTLTSAGNVTFGDSVQDTVTLSTGAVTVTTAAANTNQTYNGTIDGLQAFTANAGAGTVTFMGKVGRETPLASLTVGAGLAVVNDDLITERNFGTVDFSGVAGDVRVLNDLLIQGGTTLNFQNAGTTLVSDADGRVEKVTLAVNYGGTISLGPVGRVGEEVELLFGLVDNNNEVVLGQDAGPEGIDVTVRTMGGYVFAGSGFDARNLKEVVLVADTTIQTDNGSVLFTGTPVNAANPGVQSLTIDSGTGGVDLAEVGSNSYVGDPANGVVDVPGSPLGGLDITSGVVTASGNISTDAIGGSTGDVTVDATHGLKLLDDVTINTDAVNGDGVGGSIDLSNAEVDGAQTLAIQAGNGNVRLTSMGQETPLSSLSVASTGTTTLATDPTAITTTGTMDFSQATQVVLNGAFTGTSALGNIFLNGGNVDGTHPVSLTAPEGQVVLGDFGQNQPIDQMAITAESVTFLGDGALRGDLTVNAQDSVANFGQIRTRLGDIAIALANVGSGEVLLEKGSLLRAERGNIHLDVPFSNLLTRGDVYAPHGHEFLNLLGLPSYIFDSEEILLRIVPFALYDPFYGAPIFYGQYIEDSLQWKDTILSPSLFEAPRSLIQFEEEEE